MSSDKLAELVIGDLKSVENCTQWLHEIEQCIRDLADSMRHSLDTAVLPASCQRRAVLDLRNTLDRLNTLLVEGLGDRLNCFGVAVRERLDLYAKPLYTNTVRALSRLNTYDAERIGLLIDELTPATSAFARECRLLARLLELAKRGSGGRHQRQAICVPNAKRDQWLYEECVAGTKYSAIARQLGAKTQGWRKLAGANSIRAAAMRHADRNNLPPIPKRQSGAPRKPK